MRWKASPRARSGSGLAGISYGKGGIKLIAEERKWEGWVNV
jgi:hypothetical protein